MNIYTPTHKRPVSLAFSRFHIVRLFGVLAVLFVLTVFTVSCDREANNSNESSNTHSNAKETLYIEGPTMGTQYHIKVVVEKSSKTVGLVKLQKLINDRLIDVNKKMSTYIPSSELSLLNKETIDTWLPVSHDMFEVLMLSNDVSKASQGAFDITVGPLVNLWGFGPKKTKTIPSDEQVQTLMGTIGFDNIQLLAVEPADDASTAANANNDQNPTKSDISASLSRIKKAKDVYIDLSAIAKGFACDLIARDFRAMGLNDFMIEVGGELYVSGQSQKTEHWTIGVEKPSLTHEGALQAVSISDVGVATSGDYRNYYEVDGVRASHTLDPTTGKPITHNLVSVTVITESAAKADAYATALNVLGDKKGFALSKELNLAAYFISRVNDEYVVKYSPAFEKYLVK